MRKIIFACITLLFSVQVFAASSPLSVAILKPVQFPPQDFNVTGLRVSALWGQHRNVYGLDLGLLGNITDLEFAAVQISGLFNMTHGEGTAVGTQLAGVTNINYNKITVVGLQLAAGGNFNMAESSVFGLQTSLVNYAPFTKIYGVQFGVFNRAVTVNGFQIGLVNVADNVRGFQIGFINFNYTGVFKVSPILNFGF